MLIHHNSSFLFFSFVFCFGISNRLIKQINTFFILPKMSQSKKLNLIENVGVNVPL